jgi:hypothetical protein
VALRWTIKSPSQGFSVNRCDNRALFVDRILSAKPEKARRTVSDDGGASVRETDSPALPETRRARNPK